MASKNLEVSELLDCYGEMLTQKQRDLLEYYYDDDLSLAEIAENEGITRQGVRDIIKRAESQLFEFEEKLSFCETLHKHYDKFEEIFALANTIGNDNYNEISKKIKELTKDI